MRAVQHALQVTAIAAAAALMLASLSNSGAAQTPAPPKTRPNASSGAPKPGTPKPAAVKPGAAGENVPNAVQGFSTNRHEPIKIDADSLEVRDKEKMATFRGKVHVVQGDADLRCNVLTVFYEQPEDTGSGKASALPSPTENQRIRLLQARGNVVVTQKEQVATGDNGDFDMRKNLITLHGNVAVSQGQSVLRGDRLLVDMTTGISHIESDHKGRVQGLFQPSKGDDKSSKPHDLGILPKTQ